MLRNLMAKKDNDEGFTLIELLVVILIIGILAAIALPTFLGQSDKSKDAAAKSDARNAVTQVESCLVDNKNTDCATPGSGGLSSSGTSFTFDTAPATDGSYKLTAVSKASKQTKFTIEKKADGTYSRTCDQAGVGGCAVGGSW